MLTHPVVITHSTADQDIHPDSEQTVYDEVGLQDRGWSRCTLRVTGFVVSGGCSWDADAAQFLIVTLHTLGELAAVAYVGLVRSTHR